MAIFSINSRFIIEGEQWYFKPYAEAAKLPVSEAEYLDALAFETRWQSRAVVISAIFFQFNLLAVLYFEGFGFGIFGSIAYLILVQIVALAAAYNIPAAIATRSLRRRLREYMAAQDMPRLGWLKAVTQIQESPARIVFGGLAAIIIIALGVRDYLHRSAAFDHGIWIEARVTRSDNDNGQNLCLVHYAYTYQGATYRNKVGGCDMMKRYPAGSQIMLRIDPANPDVAVAAGEPFWNAEVGTPFLLMVLFGISWLGLWSSARKRVAVDPPADITSL